jgi:hypothetical protein
MWSACLLGADEQQDHANRESVLLPDAGVLVEEGSMIGEQFAELRRHTA